MTVQANLIKNRANNFIARLSHNNPNFTFYHHFSAELLVILLNQRSLSKKVEGIICTSIYYLYY